jgi:hypothetical protein
MASREARTFVLAAAGLVAVAAMFVWALAAPEEPDEHTAMPLAPPAPPPAPPASPPPAATRPTTTAAPATAAPPVSPTQPAPGATDPNAIDLFAGPMPEWMAELHARAKAGKWLDVRQQKELYQFGQEHKDDARPQILLAWDSRNREWWGFVVRLYQSAYDADPRSKGHPMMLPDLVDIASRYDGVEYRESAALLAQAFGEEALPRVDMKIEELRRSGDTTRFARLERLRDTLDGQ